MFCLHVLYCVNCWHFSHGNLQWVFLRKASCKWVVLIFLLLGFIDGWLTCWTAPPVTRVRLLMQWRQLVSWCFEPSQLRRITSCLSGGRIMNFFSSSEWTFVQTHHVVPVLPSCAQPTLRSCTCYKAYVHLLLIEGLIAADDMDTHRSCATWAE